MTSRLYVFLMTSLGSAATDGSDYYAAAHGAVSEALAEGSHGLAVVPLMVDFARGDKGTFGRRRRVQGETLQAGGRG